MDYNSPRDDSNVVAIFSARDLSDDYKLIAQQALLTRLVDFETICTVVISAVILTGCLLLAKSVLSIILFVAFIPTLTGIVFLAIGAIADFAIRLAAIRVTLSLRELREQEY